MSLCLLSTCVSGEYPFQFQEVTPYKHRHKPSHKGTEANETTLGNAESSVSSQKHFQTNTKGITPAPEPVKRVNSKSKKVRLTPTVPSRARQGACWGRREARLAGRRITRSHVLCNTHDPTGSPPEGFYWTITKHTAHQRIHSLSSPGDLLRLDRQEKDLSIQSLHQGQGVQTSGAKCLPHVPSLKTKVLSCQLEKISSFLSHLRLPEKSILYVDFWNLH